MIFVSALIAVTIFYCQSATGLNASKDERFARLFSDHIADRLNTGLDGAIAETLKEATLNPALRAELLQAFPNAATRHTSLAKRAPVLAPLPEAVEAALAIKKTLVTAFIQDSYPGFKYLAEDQHGYIRSKAQILSKFAQKIWKGYARDSGSSATVKTGAVSVKMKRSLPLEGLFSFGRAFKNAPKAIWGRPGTKEALVKVLDFAAIGLKLFSEALKSRIFKAAVLLMSVGFFVWLLVIVFNESKDVTPRLSAR